MKYPYLYCDIDGTLADQSIISEENVAALKKYRQAGGKLGLATGRVELITESYAKQLPVYHPAGRDELHLLPGRNRPGGQEGQRYDRRRPDARRIGHHSRKGAKSC